MSEDKLPFDVVRAAALKGAMFMLSEVVIPEEWLYSSKAWLRAIFFKILRVLPTKAKKFQPKVSNPYP